MPIEPKKYPELVLLYNFSSIDKNIGQIKITYGI
jgi:hypothetical protein